MDQGRRERLEQLLKRLGRAVRDSVRDSDEVHELLAELQADGWDAVMLLEASLVCRDDATDGVAEVDADFDGTDVDDADVDDLGQLQVHQPAAAPAAEYRIDAADARWLAALGISPTRHRSQPRRPLPPYQGTSLPPLADG
ncbi:MAG TPA: hypothetical protein VLT32_18695 [Candidatus Sulfomarinibacteraceae bacterium]|nr:hypothetical protein [Candidatus Sulfomarinibacteraceae bacterium]